MTRAICIPFHQYQPHYGDYYKLYFKNLLNNLEFWKGSFDKLYLIDSDWGFTEEDLEKIRAFGVEVEVIMKQKEGHHWVQFNTALPYLKEDQILFMDNDVVFYRKGVLAQWFETATNYDVYTAFDGSGGLKDKVQERFSLMKELDATRMGSYYFIINQKALSLMKRYDMAPIHYRVGTDLPELEYVTVEGDWSDSFGYLTIKFLGAGLTFGILEDDRSSIYLQEGIINKEPETPRDLGYYHIRNGNLATYMLATMECDRPAYEHSISIVPTREALRILAWANIIDPSPIKSLEVLKSYEIKEKDWETYLTEFKKYHITWEKGAK